MTIGAVQKMNPRQTDRALNERLHYPVWYDRFEKQGRGEAL